MHATLLAILLLALPLGSWAQISETAPPAATAVLSSNGPVVVDYGKNSFPNTPEGRIAKEVRHELLMLPYYSLFDDLEFSVQDRTVTLSGSLTSINSGTKSSAEAVVERIEGVEKVVNNIKVLPPSPLDQQVREEVFRTLSKTGSLSRYFWEAAPSLHIIVENQRVTLKGYVLNQMDKNLANIAASEVPGVFKVTNDLQVAK